MNSRNWILWAILVAALTFGLVSRANAVELPEVSLEDKVARSDIVVIARAEDLGDSVRAKEADAVTLRVLNVLKGKPSTKITLEHRSGIIEANPLCCVLGATYLMFLKHSSNGAYESVNGAHAIYLVSSP
jgi:hypothetical protein